MNLTPEMTCYIFVKTMNEMKKKNLPFRIPYSAPAVSDVPFIPQHPFLEESDDDDWSGEIVPIIESDDDDF